jgi:Na+/melibiose symporter-like transporter
VARTIPVLLGPPVSGYSPLAINERVVLANYLALLAVATYAARQTVQSVRSFSAGYAIFGWIFLVCILRAGFGDEDLGERWERANYALMGIGFGIVVGLTTYFVSRFSHMNAKTNNQSLECVQ